MKELFDVCTHDMLSAISEFAKSSVYSSMTALAIMSHGDELGNICGNDGLTTCSVQQVVDAFCQPQLKSTTKVCYVLVL